MTAGTVQLFSATTVDLDVPINTNERLLLELVAAETARAGQLHASIRHLAGLAQLAQEHDAEGRCRA